MMSIFERCAAVGSLWLALGASTGCYSGSADFELEAWAPEHAESEDPPGSDGLGPAQEMPAPTTRLFRLTHQQWENTVADLLYLDELTGLSSEFRADPFVGGFSFDNNALSLEVDQALWSGYQRAAFDVAQRVADDPELIAMLAPGEEGEGQDAAVRAQTFVQSFGQRAYRRPLTADEEQTHMELFAHGVDLYEDSAGFAAGVRLVVESMLQSPHFIYRIERSTEEVGGVIPLDSWEVASRLSYALWNTMPDDTLLAAAARGELASVEQVRAQTQRMLDDPRATRTLERFHHQLLRVDQFSSADPSPAIYPDAPEDLGTLARQEHDRFFEHTIFEQEGSWRDLLTSTETFVNDQLAALYGLPGDFGPQFERVDLDPTQRRGLLTQVGFLASYATSANSDPIHRGVFVAERIACHHVAAPPDDIPALPAAEAGQTNREAVELLTESPNSACAGCHASIINPFGFAFEGYDATGAFRTQEGERPIDASAQVALSDGMVPVDDALDLAEALAEDEQVHRCYARHWMEFAMARPHDDEDDPLVDRLAEGSLDDLSVKDLLVELTTSRPFLTRAIEELQ
ncbi:MAG: DUF1592 domain-containing protein [Myxococcota bacterium]